MKHLIFIFFLAGICYVTFFNALHNGFMVDDYNIVLWDSRGHNPLYLTDQFIPDYRHLRGIRDLSISQYFRPWAHIIPLASYALFQNEPFGYHLVNLFLFYLACVSLYICVYLFFKDMTVAAVTALLFAVHPLNGLMINYITASVFSFQLIVTLLGMIAAVKYFDGPKQWGWLVLSLFGFANGLLCHEIGLMFPFYVFCYLVFLREQSFFTSIRLSLPFWIASGIYFLFRMKVASLKTSILENIFLMDINPLTYLATFAKLLVWYFQCLFTLQGVVLIKAVAVQASGAVFWISGLAVVLGAVFLLAKFILNTRERFAMIWFAGGFLPVTLACFFQYRAGLILEPHWLIIGSIGFFMLLALMLSRLKNAGRGLWLMGIVLALALGNIKTSWAYNRLWGNEIQYCLNWFQQSPMIRPIRIYLGHACVKENRLPEAKEYFTRALDDTFFDYEVFNNLGGIAIQEGEFALARQYFQRALVLHPDSSPVHNNLGVVYFQEGLDDQAEKSYQESLRCNPYFMDARKNLADLYTSQDRWDEAIKVYEDGLNTDPFHEDSLALLIHAYLKTTQTDKIEPLVRRLIQSSRNVVLVLNTAVRLAEAGQKKLALMCFERSLRIDPDLKETYRELGKFMGNLNRFDEAVAIWTEGLKRYPAEREFSQLINQAREWKNKSFSNE